MLRLSYTAAGRRTIFDSLFPAASPYGVGVTRSHFCLPWLILALAPAATGAAMFDLVLRHGRIVDGTGRPASMADVAVQDGRIAAVGENLGEAKQVIDARGLVVVPGFIDVHTHADDLAELPRAENFVRMGVTTVVAGNCGSSAVDIAKFFRDVEATNVSVNVATLIGHGSVRSQVMGGSFLRPPTVDELARMQALVRQGMRDGAVGLSTGLIYLPGTYAKAEELIEVARPVAEFDGIYTSHMREEGVKILDGLNELFRVARETRVRAEISHIKLSGPAAWGRTKQVLAAIQRARAEGLRVTQDEYVYTASSTSLSQLVPEEWRDRETFSKALAAAAARSNLVAQMKARLKTNKRDNYAYAVIADYPHDASLNGLNVVEAARKKHGTGSLAEQIELILDIHAHGGATGVFHGISENDLQKFLRDPNTMIASDSGVRKFQEGAPHPRGYGNNARVLARYVGELKILRLEDAVRRMTSLPATTFQLRERGELRAGNRADLVVFDLAKVRDAATFGDPHHYATGFAWVFVNGVAVVKDDQHTGARPGMALRHVVGP